MAGKPGADVKLCCVRRPLASSLACDFQQPHALEASRLTSKSSGLEALWIAPSARRNVRGFRPHYCRYCEMSPLTVSCLDSRGAAFSKEKWHCQQTDSSTILMYIMSRPRAWSHGRPGPLTPYSTLRDEESAPSLHGNPSSPVSLQPYPRPDAVSLN